MEDLHGVKFQSFFIDSHSILKHIILKIQAFVAELQPVECKYPRKRPPLLWSILEYGHFDELPSPLGKIQEIKVCDLCTYTIHWAMNIKV